MTYAGFWKRVVAALIDGLVTTVLGFIAGGIFGFIYGASTETAEVSEIVGQIAGLLVGWIYFASFESSAKQATLGKIALGIKVTDLSGAPIGFGKATGRHFAKVISALILFIGYIMVAFTQRKQGLHDIMAGCLVVNNDEIEVGSGQPEIDSQHIVTTIDDSTKTDSGMDLNQNVNPWAAALILTVIGIGVAILFWAGGEEAKSRVGSYYLEHDKQGNLSVQMDHMLMRLSPAGNVISFLDLRNHGAKDVMGNVAYFNNGDFLFRAGEPESGIKSFFSLSHLPPALMVRKQSRSIEIDLQPYDKLREEWVKDLEAESGLNRCDPVVGKCDVIVKQKVPWLHRLFIDEKKGHIYVTEETRHQVTLMDLQGEPKSKLPIKVKFPKRVRTHGDGYYLIDTNHHRVIFFTGIDFNNDSLIFENAVPENSDGRKWPIDAIYFDDHWWVINADSGMTDSHLVKFDKEWSFVEHITLPDNADPLDMIIYNGKLIVSDIRLGNLYQFSSAMSSPNIMHLKKVTAYIDYLNKQKQLFGNIRKGTWIIMGLFVFIFFATSIEIQRGKTGE